MREVKYKVLEMIKDGSEKVKEMEGKSSYQLRCERDDAMIVT